MLHRSQSESFDHRSPPSPPKNSFLHRSPSPFRRKDKAVSLPVTRLGSAADPQRDGEGVALAQVASQQLMDSLRVVKNLLIFWEAQAVTPRRTVIFRLGPRQFLPHLKSWWKEPLTFR